MSNLIERKDRDGVATISLNRPDALNALSPSLFAELGPALENIAQDPDGIGCVVLRGNGRSFSAGNDLKAMIAGEVAPTPTFQAEILEFIEDMPQPVIAEVQGHCYTGALELALACDLLICSHSAKFADTHGKWAMAPGWGMSQRLPRRIGPLKAKQMMFTADPVGGEEAVRIGLANECVGDNELRDHVARLAARIVANSWHTLRADKMLVNRGQNYGLKEGLQFERTENPGRGADLSERLATFGKNRQQ